jgi:hypothetical protein
MNTWYITIRFPRDIVYECNAVNILTYETGSYRKTEGNVI